MSTAPPPRPHTIPGYNLVEPSEQDVQAALTRVFAAAGAERWAEACTAAGLRAGFVRQGARLDAALAALKQQGGAAASVARSIEIRIQTFTRLAARSAPASRASA